MEDMQENSLNLDEDNFITYKAVSLSKKKAFKNKNKFTKNEIFTCHNYYVIQRYNNARL